ncbi:sulfite exporter TauE/SafE family protein [Metabacillus iocasae]|uniref:Probable membrane transporter protein n=1 Tax=Priestia iocasae TaxID=2291674 RepID=A0ABS2QYN9_9BACI|nr:sulfite exporter TauE/SafE family protein [Metabacillus iocasae]MBM7704586.1 putative membrane protein YfcA [Metabacillus iocasae]
MEWFVLILIGLIGGTIGSLVGLGGGIIVVPALLFFGSYTVLISEVSPQVAVGTSLLVIIFTGLSSTLMYMKHKKVDYRSGLLFFIGSGPGGIIGAYVNSYLKVDSFSIYFGLFVIFTSIILMFRDKLKPRKKRNHFPFQREYKDKEGVTHIYGFHPITAIVISFIVGFSSGLFGIGGGSLMVPAMILLFAFPAHVAVATSMFMIFLSSILSSIAHMTMGNIDWSFALFLIPGAWVGGQAGAWLNTRLKSKTVIHLFRIILIVVGFRLIYEGIT